MPFFFSIRRMTPFTNSARSDGLVLRHWQRQPDIANQPPPEDAMDLDEKKEDAEAPKPLEQEYPFAKYNIKAQVPKRYTDEQYNKHLKSDDWSREETDYLMDLVEEYDLRWVVIADRYDYQPPQPSEAEANAGALVPAKRYRTMEQMKARYYFVAATMLALEHPPSEMSEAEFDLYEKMMKFDPERERARKDLAALQLNRTADEVREEGILLEELKRITANEQNFITERRELYQRLEVPVSVGNTTMYQSSQGLSQLLQTLLQADKSKKRRTLLGPEGGAPSPASQTPQNVPSNVRDSRADTPTGPPAAPSTKKTAAQANKEAQQAVKTLTPAEEAKYGVQHHDRLTPGVQFRSDKAQKLTQAKSNVQAQKLAAALAELEVPLRLVMPTERVCKEFEKLIHSVNLLLDARKVAEKVESEIRVLEAAKAERERREREAAAAAAQQQGKEKEKTEVKTESAEEQPVPSAPGGGEGEAPAAAAASTAAPSAEAPTASSGGAGEKIEGPGNVEEAPKQAEGAEAAAGGADSAAPGTPSGNSHKRSASVMSSVSDKSNKRQKK